MIDYIRKLAEERNILSEAKEKAEADALAFAAEVVSLRQELDEIGKESIEGVKQKVDALEAAERGFSNLEAVLNSVRENLKIATESVHEEFKHSRETVMSISPVLDQLYNQFGAIKEAFDLDGIGFQRDVANH